MIKYVIGGLVTIALLGLFSYTSTNGDSISNREQTNYNIPLKQKKVITTENIEYVNRLVQNGYVLQFVTERLWGTGDSHTRYTLIKY
jgi:hypothetical protein